MSQVSDYNIANASGASVRSDLNLVLDAIKTLNSGGSDPANPSAFLLYVDTADSNKLKIRNSSNDGYTEIGLVNEPNLGLMPKGGGSMTGQLLADDGSLAGSPGYSFENDTDTGMFRSGSNTIGFSTSGTTRVSISDAGLDVVNGLPIRLQDSSGSPFVSLKSPSALSGEVNLTLPNSIVDGGFLQTNSSGVLSFQVVAGVPTGSVFCMAVATVPTGYFECNGQSLNRNTYAALFAVIGTQYGAANNTTFKVPDLRGEFVRGFDNGKGVDSGRSVASSQGDQNAYHRHTGSVSGTTEDPTPTLTGNVRKISETFASGGTVSGRFSKLASQNGPVTPGNPDESPTGGFSLNMTHTHTFSDNFNTSYHPTNSNAEARPRNVAMMYIIKF